MDRRKRETPRLNPPHKFTTKYLGCIGHPQAVDLMNRLKAGRIREEIGDRLLLLEHPPVITMGRRNSAADFRLEPEHIEKKGIAVIRTDRGGKLTYHGPGQLVLYFIFNIGALGLSIGSMVWKVEEGIRLFLQKNGIDSQRDPKNPGLWVGRHKIASLGFHVERGVTTHGASLNICPDLKPFSYINPCGASGARVTGFLEQTGKSPPLKEVGCELVKNYREIF